MKTIIIVESTDTGVDKELIDNILKKRGLNYSDFCIKSTANPESKKFGSINDVLKYIEYEIYSDTKIEWIKEVQNVLIIVDADEDAEGQFNKIVEALEANQKKENFNIPSNLGVINKTDPNKINIGVFLMPDCKNIGSLETLCLKALNSNEKQKIKDCIDKYFDCLEAKGHLKLKDKEKMTENNLSKSKFRVCMATPDPDHYTKSIIESIDFESSEFDQLTNFIKQTE